jgi:uncharacterized iron-regulated membrane protein
MPQDKSKSTAKARPFLLAIHRYAGLFIAVFLFISGITGAIISWDHELDEALNPQLFKSDSAGVRQTPLTLATQLEKSDPRLRVTFLPLSIEPGHALVVSVEGRLDPATGKAFPLEFNQVALNPVSGEVQGTRFWGAVSLSRENLLPFLYKLHYTLHIPDGFGLELGMLFMGVIAVVWVIDSFIALWISFPSRRVWQKSFAFRFRKGGHALNYDAHRSGGVWIWSLLIIVAITSVALNLGSEVMRPVVSVFSDLHETPFETRTPAPFDQPLSPQVSREQVIASAEAEAAQRGWTDPAGGLFYSGMFGIYGVGFFSADNSHGDGVLGNPWLYFDSTSGISAGNEIPGTGSAGDIFLQAQFPLHSGRILGLPGRIMISLMGAVVAMLSVTGIVIWARKRRIRVRAAAVAKEMSTMSRALE